MVTSWSSGNIAHFWWNKKPISYTTPQKRATVGAMSILAENNVVDDEWKSLLSIGNFANQLFGAPFKGIQDSHEFWIPHRGFQIPRYWIPVFSQWHLDSGFKSLEGLRIPWAVFWIPKPKIPDSISKFSQILDSTSTNFLDSGIRLSLHETKLFWKTRLTR